MSVELAFGLILELLPSTMEPVRRVSRRTDKYSNRADGT